MTLRSCFTDPPKAMHPAYRFGMLALILVLLPRNVVWHINLPRSYPYDRYGNSVVGIMLLLNLLAFQFRWPTAVTATLRDAALAWLVFACFYIFHLSHALYP
jgi:hypothetical protein